MTRRESQHWRALRQIMSSCLLSSQETRRVAEWHFKSTDFEDLFPSREFSMDDLLAETGDHRK
jgi:hypothetical protein